MSFKQTNMKIEEKTVLKKKGI